MHETEAESDRVMCLVGRGASERFPRTTVGDELGKIGLGVRLGLGINTGIYESVI